MKRIAFLGVLFTLLTMSISCEAQAKQQTAVEPGVSDTIEVMYFHMTRRCLTCNTVEAEAIKNLEALYPKQVKAGTIVFRSVNLEEADSKVFIDRAQAKGQSLIIVAGNQRSDLTNVGFMHARNQPQRFRQAMKTAIDPLLKSK